MSARLVCVRLRAPAYVLLLLLLLSAATAAAASAVAATEFDAP